MRGIDLSCAITDQMLVFAAKPVGASFASTELFTLALLLEELHTGACVEGNMDLFSFNVRGLYSWVLTSRMLRLRQKLIEI